MYLLAHWLGIGDGGAEESIVLETAVQTGPVVVPVAGVRKTPRDQSVVLLVQRIAWLAGGTGANAPQITAGGISVLLVLMSIHSGEENAVKLCLYHFLKTKCKPFYQTLN